MTTDRELLEMAAKAAGIEFNDHRAATNRDAIYAGPTRGWWNPLTDDGDALRLAVALQLSVTIFNDAIGVGYRVLATDSKYEEELIGTDPYAATRRAIVRAAAALARLGGEA